MSALFIIIIIALIIRNNNNRPPKGGHYIEYCKSPTYPRPRRPGKRRKR